MTRSNIFNILNDKGVKFLPLIVIFSLLASTTINANEVNVYSARKGYLLQPLVDAFERETNIKVNVISGKAKVLQKRIIQEGKNDSRAIEK